MENQLQSDKRVRRSTGSMVPPPAVTSAVRDMIDQKGEVYAANRLGMGRITVVRVAGGMPCRRGTALMVALALGIDIDGEAR